MATQRRSTVQAGNQNITYIYGSAVSKVEPVPQRRTHVEDERRTNQRVQRKPRVHAKAVPVNKPLLVLTLVAFAMIGFMVIQYISLNSEISILSSSIASLERSVNELRAENDEYRSRIMSNVDLEKVREVAIMDLGMVYASKDQIITYNSQVDDYVEQSRVIKD